MAIYHLHVSIVSRKTGRSSVAAAAYRAGEKLYSEYDGLTHDCSRMSNAVNSAINSRRNEYFADWFAFRIGYGDDLVSALYLLTHLLGAERLGL